MNIGICVCINPAPLLSCWILILFHRKQVPSEYIRVNHWHLHRQHSEWRQNAVKILRWILPASQDQQHRAGIHISSVSVSDFSCSGLWEGHESTSMRVTCRLCLFSVGFSVFLTTPHYWLSDSDHSSPTWAKFFPCVATFFFSQTFHHSFFTSWCLAPHSNCWLTLKGASSEFSTLCVIFSGKKDKKKQVTKTTVDTFTARFRLSSMEKKACNYVSSLTVIQLLDYRDRTCTIW